MRSRRRGPRRDNRRSAGAAQGATLGGGAWGQAWGGSEVTGGPAVSMSRRVAAAKLAVLRFYRG